METLTYIEEYGTGRSCNCATEKLAYSIEEAAVLIGATKNQIQDAVTERRIRHSRPFGARNVRITREHLLDFISRNEVEPQQ